MPAGREDNFAHLHVHTEYSMLDGAARIAPLLARAKELGQEALAITDHGYLFGAYEFWSEARAAGIKPIVGLEAYLTPGTARQDRVRVAWGDGGDDDVSSGGAYTHMTLWAKDTPGMHNLFRMGSLASIEGFFFKPRMDRDLFQTYARGLIGTTGCPSGEVQTRLRLGQYAEARRVAAEYQDILGRENYYVEIMDHGIDIERRVIKDLIRLARDIGAPLVATNDLHYTHRDDAAAHDALLCVQVGKTLEDTTRFRFDGDGYYLKSAAEMRQTWRELPEACDSTLAIAEACQVDFTESLGKYMPRFATPPGEDETSWFVKEVERGLGRRFPEGIPQEVRKQAEYETGVIVGKGYAGYYLVVADFIDWSKKQGIRVGPGRGSGAGSTAAYALGITELDPLRHGLIFERFLNPERPSLPDFDVDFDERRRGEVIRYVTDKYGADHVAQIVTYGTIKAKAALKDAARVLGYPYAVGERLTKALPAPAQGKDVGLTAVFDPKDERYGEAAEFRAAVAGDQESERVVATARGLENLVRQWGVHAAGVIMSSEPLMDIIPIMRRERDGAIITQFAFPQCEALGLVKMDFLGLRNLTILDDALEGIVHNGGPAIVLEELPLDDAATYELLSSGETLGVFQLDGGGMRSLLRQLRPDNFEDISAVQALYRPGPMGAESHTNYALRKNGLQPITPLHPELAEALAPILSGTYGLIVYQEQVMEIARALAGYTMGEADNLRRAMGKKKKSVLDENFIPFSGGMRERGFSDDAINALWETLVPFADYAFNKAHSAAYGLVSYWTAYLKAHYPVEYMAALLTSVKDDKDKSAVYLAECRRMGITVLGPEVNSSAATFTPAGESIRFGLSAVRNVGDNVVAGIVGAREAKGAYTSFLDFLSKVPAHVCNRRVLESLIKAGAFDSFGHSRRALITVYEDALDAVVDVKRNEARGQFDLFGELAAVGTEAGGFGVDVPDLPEWNKDQTLAFEREMLGLYVSDHPLRGLEKGLAAAATHPVSALATEDGVPDGSVVTVSGLLHAIARKATKTGKLYAVAVVEDLDAEVEVMFFSKLYERVAADLREDAVVAVTGRVNRRDDRLTVYASDLRVLALSQAGEGEPVQISLPAHRVTASLVSTLRGVLADHPGSTEVHVRLTGPGGETVLRLQDGLRVEAGSALFGDLRASLGNHCVSH
jgi:DNA polymerase-3 subunit alpha